MQSGRYGKIENDLIDGSTNSLNGYYNTINSKDMNGHGNNASKQDDHNMMEVLLKSTVYDNNQKKSNSQYGSNSSIATSTTGGLPGLRGRTRQSISGSKKS